MPPSSATHKRMLQGEIIFFFRNYSVHHHLSPYFNTIRVFATVLYFSGLQIRLMQQYMEEIMKNIKIHRADLKSMIITIALPIVLISSSFVIALPRAFRGQDRAFAEEKLAD